LHRRVLQEKSGQRLLTLRHGLDRTRLRAFGDDLHRTRVLQRKKAFGADEIRRDGQHQRQGKGGKCGQRSVQHPVQTEGVNINQALQPSAVA